MPFMPLSDASNRRRPFRNAYWHGRSPTPGRHSIQVTVREASNGSGGVSELGGRVQDLRLQEPKNKTMSSSPSSDALAMSSAKSETSDDDLPRILECPVCYTIPENEVFNCEKGHSVCGKCRLRLSQCALCTSAFNGSRNFLVESLISYYKKVGFSVERTKPSTPTKSKILVICEHANQGCQIQLPYSEIDEHAGVCEFRPISCIVDGRRCSEIFEDFQLSEYIYHLKVEHQINGLSEPSGFFMKTDRLFRGFEINTNWLPFYLEYDGKCFLRNAALKNRRVSWWIQLIGSDSESRKYSATISLQSPNNPNFKISWTTPVFPIRCDEKRIDQHNIATISTTRILPFCTLNQQFEDKVVTHMWNCQIILNRVN